LVGLLELADNQTISNPNSKFTIITIGAINYKPVVHNWVRHMKRLNISNYIVLCADKLICEEMDPAHAILMAPTLRLNLTSARRWRQRRIPKRTYSGGKPKVSSLSRRLLRTADTVTDTGFSGSITGSFVPSEFNSEQALRIYRKRVRDIGLGRAFSVLMIIKHSAIYALLSAGHSVVWSDVDCLWIQRCAYDTVHALARPTFREYYSAYLHNKGIQQANRVSNFNNYSGPALRDRVSIVHQLAQNHSHNPDFIDFASQQGLYPQEMSGIIGTAICTGFFVVNPTPAALLVIREVRNSIIRVLASAQGGMGDQNTMNTVLLKMAKMKRGKSQYVLSTFSDSALEDVVVDKFEYGPSATTGRPQDVMFKMKVLLDPNRHQQIPAPLIRRRDEEDKKKLPFTVGFLPYDLFPRGDAGTHNVQQLQEQAQEQVLQRPAEYSSAWAFSLKRFAESAFYRASSAFQSAPQKPRPVVINTTAVLAATKQRNADEWNALSSKACIWHMYAQKTGDSKVESMQRDGVLADSRQEDDDQEANKLDSIVGEDKTTVETGDALDAFQV
jgi:hypothetical protein